MRIRQLTISTLIWVLTFLCVLPAWATELTSAKIDTLYNDNFNATPYSRVSVHDPSVVIGYKKGDVISGEYSDGAEKVYYIFGSHVAWARSTDLKNWTSFSNNINSNFTSLFATPAAWSAKGSSGGYNLSGMMWAPDVIWNKEMQKWCMYMSINGDFWYSSIVLLTASSLDGDWTYVGPVVYSGFTNQAEAELTDFYEVIDKSAEGFPSRYNQFRFNVHSYALNAIDPCVFYDENGTLWMSYGSWFGGIYLLKLDGTSGLRDYTQVYQTTDGTAVNATSDAYQGHKIAGGNQASGEASYIQNINGKYYLFMTNGGLAAAQGYNMRVFVSDQPTGPYVDMTGQDARYSSSNTGAGDINGEVGLRLMSYYKWPWLNDGFTAQGHNSAMVDDDGKSYLVFHTRFDNGNEGHQVRVHQLFQAKNGQITAAPFQYSGETLATTPYGANDVVGRYGILYHGYGTDFNRLECVQEQEIVLNADGSVTGDYTGTWSQNADGPYLTIAVKGITFQGVLVTQEMQGLGYNALCFSVVGNDMSIYGYKMGGDAAVAYNVKNLKGAVPSAAYSGMQLTLPTKGHFGATYAWSWSTDLISAQGVVADLTADASVPITLTISCNGYSYATTSTLQLTANSITDMLPAGVDTVLETYATIADFNAATPNRGISVTTGLSLSFYLKNITSDWDLIAHSTDDQYSLLLSVLRYNGADFYEAKASLSPAATAAGYTASTAWQIFLNTSCIVTVSYNVDGSITYYKDGELMLTYAAAIAPSYGSGVTPASMATAVINYYRTRKLKFDNDVNSVIVSYAVDYDPRATTSASGIPLDVAKLDFDAESQVYNLSGIQVAYGRLSAVQLPTGLYIVRQGNQVYKIVLTAR